MLEPSLQVPERPASFQEAFEQAANQDMETFRRFFHSMREAHAEEATAACLWYLAENGLTSAGWEMTFWLLAENRFLDVLFSPHILPTSVAARAAGALKEADPQFYAKFNEGAAMLKSTSQILRALALLPALGDYSAALPWLQSIERKLDDHLKRQSDKLCAGLDAKRALAQPNFRSNVSRVRANAVEALWGSQTEDAAAIFRLAAKDTNHRVVGNALVGLYMQNDPTAFPAMAKLASHPESLFRAATAWCFGRIVDPRGVPYLRDMLKHPSEMVRNRALVSLLALSPDEAKQALEEAAA